MQVQTFTKAYLVEFTDKISGYRFLKFGATNNYDVYQRFQHEPEQYKDYDIEVIGSIYAKQKNINYKRMGEVEDYFLSRIIKEFYDIKTMILRGEDIKDVIKENEEGDGTVRDFDRRASESFQSRSIILRKKKYEGHKTTEPIISCDCMFGCNICNPPLTNCTAPDPTDWY